MSDPARPLPCACLATPPGNRGPLLSPHGKTKGPAPGRRPLSQTFAVSPLVLSCPLMYPTDRSESAGTRTQDLRIKRGRQGSNLHPTPGVVLCPLSYALKSVALPTELPTPAFHRIGSRPV